MEVSVQLKVASFFDPADPRQSLEVLFERFKSDPEMLTLHVGISYCFSDDSDAPGGDLFIVKNRLPPSMKGNVRPRVHHMEVAGGGNDSADMSDSMSDEDDDEDTFVDLRTDELGSFGCCDCCHVNGLNCGPKFPHGSFAGYLYLTPRWASSLMRLGYAVSREATHLVRSKAAASAPT
uniref:Uncharacterized protein n=1 Tax=Zooxanthella nutricula TaxID=1333877 RepID=A0A7S2VQK9_9DINO